MAKVEEQRYLVTDTRANPSENYSLRFRYGESRGMYTLGYIICSLFVDGMKVASCDGGGYDMTGTSLAQWMAEKFQDRLHELNAHNLYKATAKPLEGRKRKVEYDYEFVQRPDEERGFYGLTRYEYEDGSVKCSLDGACGVESMWRIAQAIGLERTYLP